jgi:hypothetical protein
VRDLYADYGGLTLRITMAALFGADTEAPQAQRIVGAIERAFDFFARRGGSAFALPEWVPSPENLEFGAAVQQLDRVGALAPALAPCLLGLLARVPCLLALMHAPAAAAGTAVQASSQRLLPPASQAPGVLPPQVVYGLIAQRRRATVGSAPGQRADLLQALLESRDEDGSGMGDVALRDELMTLMVRVLAVLMTLMVRVLAVLMTLMVRVLAVRMTLMAAAAAAAAAPDRWHVCRRHRPCCQAAAQFGGSLGHAAC